MVYSNTTTKDGIIQTMEELCDLGDAYISGDTTRLRQFTARINRIAHRVWHTIFMANGSWQYDDGNYTDLPSATADLVSGTRKYALPSDALTVQRVEAKNEAGDWYVLKPLDKERIALGLDEFMETDGQPNYYRLVNGVIELMPGSNYASTGGLKVYFDRDSVDFAYNATTATPGFASPYHEIIPIKASIEWLKVKQPQSPTLQVLLQDDLRVETSLKEYYGKRFKDKVKRIGRAYSSYK